MQEADMARMNWLHPDDSRRVGRSGVAADAGREEPRSWSHRAAGIFTRRADPARVETRPPGAPNRGGPSDRLLSAVIAERLAAARSMDTSRVEVAVENGEVFLSGWVRRRGDRQRIEDIVFTEGVTHVRNDLRIGARGPWTFI
jgi:hypothetical protein